MNDLKNVNSSAYWNTRFEEDWVPAGGREQSVFFAHLAFDHLPPWIVAAIRSERLQLVDWGCALGDGTNILAKYVEPANLVGVDFSEVAIAQASERYPSIRFLCEDWIVGGLKDAPEYDVVFSSNTLEHLDDPVAALDILASHARKAVILALPFREMDRSPEHFHTFFPQNIAVTLSEGFRLVWANVVNCRALPGTAWLGEQIILVYAREDWLRHHALSLSDCRIDEAPSYEMRSQRQRAGRQDEAAAELSRRLEAKERLLEEAAERLDEAGREKADLNDRYELLRGSHEVLLSTHEALTTQYAALLQSRSWRLTRVLRVAAGALRQRRQTIGLRRGLYALAARCGRAFPFPLWLKARVRAALVPRSPARGSLRVSRRGVDAVTGRQRSAMKAALCGLVEDMVSIVLPVYNQAQLLEQSIESVLAQSYKNFELIVINDGSTDGVELVLNKYVGHPKVRCFSQNNQRLPRALSNGFDFARGEFWTWTSADNIMEPGMLAALVGKLKSNPGVGMVYADYYAIDDRGEILKDPSWRAHNRPDPKSGEIRLPRSTESLNAVQDNFIGPCFMYRGWIGRCLGDYDTPLGIEDYDYWMRINAFFKVEHLGSSELLYRYRVHDNTLSARAQEHKILEKVQRLMEYEGERSAAFAESICYRADEAAEGWLRAQSAPADAIRAWREANHTPGEVVVLSSRTAQEHAAFLVEDKVPVAVLLDASAIEYHKLRPLLLSGACIVIAADALSAQRSRLIAPLCPVVDSASDAALLAVEAFVKNLSFIRRTRSEGERSRVLPSLILPKARHVLLQVDSFTQGGLENVVLDLSEILRENGFEVSIANFGAAGEAAFKAKQKGFRVHSLSAQCSTAEYASFLVEKRVDVVNAHYSVRGVEACRDVGVPFVQTIHNSYVWLEPENVDRYRAIDPITRSYLCVSLSAARYADVVLELDVGKMHVLPNGVDAKKFAEMSKEARRSEIRGRLRLGHGDPVFLNVASVMASKAQLPLVKAFVSVARELPNARLVLLGATMEAAYGHAVKRFVEKNQLERNVIFAGYDPDVVGYYQAADVFVLPSHWEGWSLSLGEALMSGLPCVITDVGSADDFAGMPSVTIVEPPFGDIVRLSHENIGRFVYDDDQGFISRLSEAMLRSAKYARTEPDAEFISRLDSRRTYQSHVDFLGAI